MIRVESKSRITSLTIGERGNVKFVIRKNLRMGLVSGHDNVASRTIPHFVYVKSRRRLLAGDSRLASCFTWVGN